MKALLKSLLILSAVCSLKSFAQEPSLRWGKPVELGHFHLPVTLVGRSDSSVFVLHSQRPAYISDITYGLSRFSKDALTLAGLSLFKDKTYKGHEYENIVMCKGRIYLFSSVFEYQHKRNTIYAQEIDKTGLFIGTSQKICEIPAFTSRSRGSFTISLSTDSTKIYVIGAPAYDTYEGEKFVFKVLDSGLKVLSGKEVTMPYKGSKLSISRYCFSTGGTIFMLSWIPGSKEEPASYSILSVPAGSDSEVRSCPVRVEGKKVTAMGFSLNKEGSSLICTGLYTEIKADRDDIQGVVLLKLNANTGGVEARNTKELDKNFAQELTAVYARKQGGSGFYSIKDFVGKEDGGMIVVAENYCEYEETVYFGNQSSLAFHSVRGNILAVNIKPDGAIDWYTAIAKNQHTANDFGIYSSYIVTRFNGKTYFIYNDNKNNLKVTEPRDIQPMIAKTSMPVMVVLDDQGKYKKQLLEDQKAAPYYQILPEVSARLPGQGLLICSHFPIPRTFCTIPISKATYRLGYLKL